MKERFINICVWCGMLLILAGLFLPFFTGPADPLYKYIFATGSGLNIIGRLLTHYDGRIVRVRRLLRIETWASLFFCVAAYFMFTDPDPRNWIVFVLAGGVLMAYTSIMIPRAQRKENQK